MTTTRTLLDGVVASRSAADREEARLLGFVAELCDLHPVVGDVVAASWCDPCLVGQGEPVAGVGTPAVAEDAVVELAAALEVSYRSGLRLVGDVLELRHRLPRLWALVHDGVLQAWKARQAAEHTRLLSPDAVAWVDRHLAVAAGRGRLTRATVVSAVREAVLRFDADHAPPPSRRGVWFDTGDDAATTTMTATLDTLDALALDDTIGGLAVQLGRLGDRTDLDTRRATALGVLADPQAALELAEGREPQGVSTGSSDRAGRAATLYVHLTRDDLAQGTVGTVEGVGLGPGLGPATLDLLADWLARSPKVVVRPVLAMDDQRAVDRHDPPEAMREQVVLRDRVCVFPGCTTSSRRADLDHVVPYDDTGPPGQTSAANLAPLCRRHHRAKTHRGWRYHRTPTGHYLWSSPAGRVYDVP